MIARALCLPPWGKVAPQGRMREKLVVAACKQITVARFPLISQRSGPLTAPPLGEAFSPIDTAFPSAYNETIECLIKG